MNQKIDPTAAKLRGLVSECAICTLELEGHRYAELATTVIDQLLKGRITEFLSHARRHEWNKLVEFKDFRGDRDDLVAFALTGSHSGGMVIVIHDPFELYEGPQILVKETLTAEDVAAISSLLPLSAWKQL
jgi:hypothetical protein